MESTKEHPRFPALDIDFDWIEGLFENDPLILDRFYYSKSDLLFESKTLKHRIVDSTGDMYEITGKLCLSKWRNLIPFRKKAELKFKKLNKTMSLDELKDFMIEKINTVEINEQFKSNWINEIKDAKSFEVLLLGASSIDHK